MKTTIAAWNIQEGLAAPSRSQTLVEGIKQLDADVVMLTDAYWLGNPLHTIDSDLVEEAQQTLSGEGYSIFSKEYQDESDPYPQRFMVGLARPYAASRTINIDGRNALKLTVPGTTLGTDDDVDIYGVHLDDRDESRRIAQAYHLLANIAPENDSVVIGDFNSLNRDSVVAKMIRATLGRLERADHMGRSKLARVQAVATKLGGMASGTTLEVLQTGRMTMVTENAAATFPSHMPVLELDRCFVSADMQARLERQPHRPGSDHRALKLVLES